MQDLGLDHYEEHPTGMLVRILPKQPDIELRCDNCDLPWIPGHGTYENCTEAVVSERSLMLRVLTELNTMTEGRKRLSARVVRSMVGIVLNSKGITDGPPPE